LDAQLRAAGQATLGPGQRQQLVTATQLPAETAGSVLRDAVAPRAPSRVFAVVLRRLLRVAPDEPLETLIERARRNPVFELRSQPAAA
jgi:hypothetical protein